MLEFGAQRFERNKNVSSPSTCKTQYCGEPPRPRGSVLGLRPPGLEFQILCLEGSVISFISPSVLVILVETKLRCGKNSTPHMYKYNVQVQRQHLVECKSHSLITRLAHSRSVISRKPLFFKQPALHHPQEVLLAQFSLYVHKGGLKPNSFHLPWSTTSKLLKICVIHEI